MLRRKTPQADLENKRCLANATDMARPQVENAKTWSTLSMCQVTHQ